MLSDKEKDELINQVDPGARWWRRGRPQNKHQQKGDGRMGNDKSAAKSEKKPRKVYPKLDPLALWTRYRVHWTFLNELCGSTPADPDLMASWLDSRKPRVKPPGAPSIQELAEEVQESLERGEGEAPTDYSMLVFQAHENVLVMRADTVRAHLKDCARVISADHVPKIQGVRAFSTRVINGVYLPKTVHWLPIKRNGADVAKADGTTDKPVHTRARDGSPINALKRYEWLQGVTLEFELLVLKSVSQSDLETVLEYGGVHGYGGERSAGKGRYDFTIERVNTDEATAAVA